MSARPMDIITGKPHRRRSGFTLIELLIVIVIMGTVSGIGIRIFFGMTSAWHDLKSMADLDSVAYSAFQSMHADFADVVSAELSGASIRGRTAEYEYDRLKARYMDDQIILPVQTSVLGELSLTGGSVRYYVARDETEGTHHLVRTVGDLTEDLPVSVLTNVIDRANVLSLRFEFLADESSEWKGDGWDSPELPAAVRVSITLADADRNDLQISRKTVFPIHVR